MNKKLLQDNLISITTLFCITLCLILYISSPAFCDEYNNIKNLPTNSNKTILDNSNNNVNNIQIQLDNTPISFEISPEIVNGNIMVPAGEFFENMRAYVIWNEEQKIIVAYRDNMHLKLLIDKNEAYQNGHRINLPQDFIIKDNHILIPIQIIANTFNLHQNWNIKENILYLSSSSENLISSGEDIKTFQDDIYKTISIKELDISFSIPYKWSKLDENYKYGYNDNLESYSFMILSKENDNTTPNNNKNETKDNTLAEKLNLSSGDVFLTLNSLYENKIDTISEKEYTLSNFTKVKKIIFESWIDDTNSTQSQPNNDLTTTKEQDNKINNYAPVNIDNGFNYISEDVDTPYAKTDDSNETDDSDKIDTTTNIPINTKIKQHNILYIITSNKKTYYIICSQGKTVDINVAEKTFDNIISTFIIRNESIDTNEEHYVEFNSFYKYGFNLSKQYHSNMIIDNSKLNFSGNILPKNDIKYLKIDVCHHHENIGFSIPIDNNAFDGTIHLPFGLGQHNLSIYTVNAENTDVPLMQFSVINIDRTSTRYTIPTSKIQSDDPKIESIAQTITYKHNTKYKSSYAIFHWITHNMNIIQKNDNDITNNTPAMTDNTTPNSSNNTLNTLENYKVFENTKGSMEEINQLLVAMLRTTDIPSRVVSGKDIKDDNYYWTELNLNGAWVAADPISDINYLNNDFLAPTNSKFVPIIKYRQSFEDINIQNY